MSVTTCLMDNYNLLGHSPFPRELLPLSKMVGASLELVATVPALVIVGALQGISPPVTLVALPLVVGSLLVFAAALCIICSTIQVFVRDLQFVMTFVTTGLFFASPISFEPDQFPSWASWMNSVNPISVDIKALRDVVLRGRWPDWGLFGLHLVLAVGLLLLAIAHLRSVAHRMVDLG